MSIDKFSKYAIVRIEGNIYTDEEAKTLEYEVDEIISEHFPIIVLDFKKVENINSCAIAKMLEIYRNIQASKGTFAIINLSEEVETVLKSLVFFNLIKKYDSESDIIF